MKLLLDEQISGRVAERLRTRGHDVIAVAERAALRGSSDIEVFDLAQAEDRVVVTYNRDDFLQIAREIGARNASHAGLVIVHPRRLPNNELARLAAALDSLIRELRPYPGFVHWLSD